MKTRTTVLILFTTLLMVLQQSCTSRQEGKRQDDGKMTGQISISGAFALYPMTVKWAEEFMKVNPGVRIDISAGGAGKGMTDVLSGMVDLAMVSREVSQEESALGAWYIAVTKDAVLPTVNSSNPGLNDILAKGLTREILQEIYLSGESHTWSDFFDFPDNNAINVYTRSDACGAAEMWGKYLGKNQESLMDIGVFGDPGIADAVKNDKYAIGYNNVIYAYDIKSRNKYKGMEIIPLDIDGDRKISPEEQVYSNLDEIMKAIQNGIYPSPPARDLYLVSKGKPTDAAVILFLEWILENGQQYVHESGYVELSAEKLDQESSKLK